MSFTTATQGLDAGSRVGPYEVRERIGDGGMAAVFKAWHTGLARFEALKIPRHQSTHGPEAEFVRRLLAEARTAAGLQHPNIVAIHSVSDPAAPIQYFSMEFVEGLDLDRLIQQRGRLSLQEALPILRQMAAALDYAHGRGVVHRDIKPANILLTPQGADGQWHVRVVDFGISRAAEDSDSTRLTKSGMIVGTPEYMSPEQAGSGDPVTYRTDLYSLGVVAYEMLCGEPPFTADEGVSRMAILMQHVRAEAKPPVARLPWLHPSASDAILKTLAKDPQERFVTCTDFVTALEAALALSAPPVTSATSIREATMARPGTLSSRMQAGAQTMATPTAPRETALDMPAVDTDIVRWWRSAEHRPARPSFVLATLGGVVMALLLILVVRQNNQPESAGGAAAGAATPHNAAVLPVAAAPTTAPPLAAAPVPTSHIPVKIPKIVPLPQKIHVVPLKSSTPAPKVASKPHWKPATVRKPAKYVKAPPSKTTRNARRPARPQTGWKVASSTTRRTSQSQSGNGVLRRRSTESRETRLRREVTTVIRRELGPDINWRDIPEPRPRRMPDPLPGLRRDSMIYTGPH